MSVWILCLTYICCDLGKLGRHSKELRAERTRKLVSVPGSQGIYRLCSIHAGSGAHQALYIVDTRGFFPGG
jgi:hypothetical protein